MASAGPYWPFGEVEVGPPPVQRPHPPLFVAGTSDDTLRFAVARGLPLMLSLEPPESGQLAGLARAAEALGRTPDLAGNSLARYVCIAPTRARAEADAGALLVHLHERRRHFARLRGDDPDALVPRGLADFMGQQAIVGAPDDCIAQIQAVVQRLGVGHLRCTFNGTGAIPRDAALGAMGLFAREVLPVFHQPGDRHPHDRC